MTPAPFNMIPRRRRPRASSDAGAVVLDLRRAAWRATGLRIVAFKNSPPGTSSADFNRRPA